MIKFDHFGVFSSVWIQRHLNCAQESSLEAPQTPNKHQSSCFMQWRSDWSGLIKKNGSNRPFSHPFLCVSVFLTAGGGNNTHCHHHTSPSNLFHNSLDTQQSLIPLHLVWNTVNESRTVQIGCVFLEFRPFFGPSFISWCWRHLWCIFAFFLRLIHLPNCSLSLFTSSAIPVALFLSSHLVISWTKLILHKFCCLDQH